MPRPRRNRRPRPRPMQGEDAFDRRLNRIRGGVREDGSFRTQGGRVFDAERNRYRQPVPMRPVPQRRPITFIPPPIRPQRRQLSTDMRPDAGGVPDFAPVPAPPRQLPTGMLPDAGMDLDAALSQPYRPRAALPPRLTPPTTAASLPRPPVPSAGAPGSMPPAQQSGPRLARPLANPGSRGQNMRYDVSGLQRLPSGHYTDGVYTYDENGLSLDRPDQAVPGLPPADENYEDWWRANPGGPGAGGGAASFGAGSAGGFSPMAGDASFADIAALLSGAGGGYQDSSYGAQPDESDDLLAYLLSLLGRVPGNFAPS